MRQLLKELYKQGNNSIREAKPRCRSSRRDMLQQQKLLQLIAILAMTKVENIHLASIVGREII